MKKVISLILIAMVAYVFVGVVGSVVDLPEREDNEIELIKGDVDVFERSKWRSASKSKKLISGSELRTAEGAYAELELINDSIVRIDENSHVKFLNSEYGKTNYDTDLSLEVVSGKVWFMLPSLTSSSSSFSVLAGTGKVDVMGTSFMLEVNGDDVEVSAVSHIVSIEVGDKKEYLFASEQLSYNDEGHIRRGAINHKERDDLFFKLSEQKDIKYLDNLNREIDSKFMKSSRILPGNFLYEPRKSFESFWSSFGNEKTEFDFSMKYAARRLFESMNLIKKGQVGFAKEHLVTFQNEIDSVLSEFNVSDDIKTEWAYFYSNLFLNIPFGQDYLPARDVVMEYIEKLLPAELKEDHMYYLSYAMLMDSFDFDSNGFDDLATESFNEFYALNSQLLRDTKDNKINFLLNNLFTTKEASEHLSADLRVQVESYQVEMINIFAEALSDMDSEEQVNIVNLFLEGFLNLSDHVSQYFALMQFSEIDNSIIKNAADKKLTELANIFKNEYLSNEQAEQKKSYISSMYFRFGENENILDDFIGLLNTVLSYNDRIELNKIVKGSVYLPPAALSKLDELRKIISDKEYEAFLDDLRFRNFEESEILNWIDVRLKRSALGSKFSNGVKVQYQQDGELKDAVVPIINDTVRSNKITGSKPVEAVVDNVVTEEDEMRVVDSVITE